MGHSTSSEETYSIPSPQSASETDNAQTEYIIVKEIRNPSACRITRQSEAELEIYSASSTLSLGETVILSDGWLNRSTEQILPPLSPTPNSNAAEEDNSEDNSHIVLTLDVDTSASVI